MRSIHKVYVGPYLVVPAYAYDTIKKVSYCSKCGAHSSPSHSFCSICGGGIMAAEDRTPCFHPPSLHRLPDEWTDVMFSPSVEAPEENTAVWLPNKLGFDSIEPPSEGKAYPLSSIHIDIPKAEEYYKDFVAFVESEFGIKTRWDGGLVLYRI